MVTKQKINQKWWTYRSHEAQALNLFFATKTEDEQKYLSQQTEELKRINSNRA